MKNFLFITCLNFLLVFQACKSTTNKSIANDDESLETIVEPDTVIEEEIIEPVQIIDYDTTQWAEIVDDEYFVTDIRYATDQNFMKRKIYNCGRCFVRPHVKDSLIKVAKSLLKDGYKVIMYDCYRPKRFQQALWDIMPDARYVTPPKRGSMHNRGVAVDVGLIDMNGKLLDMGTDYDFFGKEAYPGNKNVDPNVYKNRQYLKKMMNLAGLAGIRTEWWHFSIKKNAPAISDWLWSCE